MSFDLDIDDVGALEAHDPGGMLRAIASGGAQVRTALLAYDDAAATVASLVADGRPRSVVIAGMGGSGVSGDVLAAVLGPGCPVPVQTVRDYVLPGWVGALDLVIPVSCSGGTEETLELTDEALRRGARVFGIGAPGSPLAERIEAAGAAFLPVVNEGRQPRASLWSITVPLLLVADALGLGSVPREVLETVADRLDADAERFGPASATDGNAAKRLALELAGTVPMVWGTGVVGGTAAYRTSCQFNENGKYPAVHGALPEANHNQVVSFDGPFGIGASAGGEDDLFRDRVEDPHGAPRLQLLLVRDSDEHPQVARRAEISASLAADRGIGVSQVRAEPGHPVQRIAELISITDFATAYVGLLVGVDPTPVGPITELKQRIAVNRQPAR